MFDGSGDAQKIPFSDLDAIVTKNAVGGRGMEVEVRKCEAIEEFLTLQRQGFIGADRESDFASFCAFSPGVCGSAAMIAI